MKIYLIRHGETTGDIEGRFGGNYDDHLSPQGCTQAALLAKQFLGKHIDVIVSSPFQRARETAGYLAKVTGAPIELLADIRERNSYGVITGMTKLEALAIHPDLVEIVKDRLSTIDGAESYEAFAERFRSGLAEIISTYKDKTVAIVTHGGPLRVLFRDILKLGELTSIGDCSFVELEVTDDGYKVGEMQGIVTAF